MTVTPEEKKALRKHFSVAEDHPYAAMVSGWTVTVRELLDSGRLDAVVKAVADSGIRGLTLEIGAHDIGESENDRVVLGVQVAGTDQISDEIALERVLGVAAGCEQAAKLGNALAPFDVEAAPGNWLIAQGPLCNVMLMLGAKTDFERIYDEDGRMREEMEIGRLDYRRSLDRGQDERGGIYGQVVAQAGPWQSPMSRELQWSHERHEEIAAKLSGAGFRPAYHLMYSYGN